MKIGLSTSVIQGGKSGVAQYVFALVEALARHEQHLELILFVLEKDVPLFGFAKYAKIIPVPERYRSPIRNILWHQTVLPLLARAHELDVLHIPSYRRMLWFGPCPLVTTIHDLAPFHVAKKYDWLRMFYGRVVARWLARRQDSIITVSHNTRRDVERFFGIPDDQLKVVHNGIDHARFFPGSVDEAKACVAEQHKVRGPFFLYVARLEHPAKNHVRLIRAFNLFKARTRSDWKLVFGGSDWHGADAIHSAVQQSPFRRDIFSLGFVEPSALPKLYRAADVFVYPSLFEGFGFPPLEAMACGCPVICSNRGALGEIVGDAAVIVDPEDAQALQKQLSRVACEPELRRQLRESGLARAEGFDWDDTAVRTLETYRGVAKTKKQVANASAVELPG